MMRTALAVLFGLGTLMEMSISRADTPHNDPSVSNTVGSMDDLYVKAKTAFAHGDNHRARELYARIWQQQKTFELAANLGQVELSLDMYVDAAEHLAFAIRNAPPSQSEATIQLIRKLLAQATEKVGTLRFSTDRTPTRVVIDNIPIPEWHPNQEVYVLPGAHWVLLEQGSDSVGQNITVTEGGSASVVVTFPGIQKVTTYSEISSQEQTPTTPSTNPTGAAEQPFLLRESHAGVLLLGGGIALAGVGLGGIFLHSANRADDDASRLNALAPCTTNCGAPSYANNARYEAQRSRVTAITSFSLGGVAALGTAAFFLWVPEDPENSRSTRPILSGAFIGLGGLATGIAATIAANADRRAINLAVEASHNRGVCLPGTDSIDQCADLLTNNRAYDEHRELAVGGFTLAGAAAIGTTAYLLWPDSSSSLPVRATVSVERGNRTLIVFGQF